jgi:hypothetical protein
MNTYFDTLVNIENHYGQYDYEPTNETTNETL